MAIAHQIPGESVAAEAVEPHESMPSNVQRSRLFWAIGLGVAGLLTGIMWAIGASAFPLVLVALVAGGIGLAQFSNLRLGMLGALALLLGGYAILLHFTNIIPWGLAAIGGAALLLMVCAGMAALLRSGDPILPSANAMAWGAVLLSLALVASVVFIPLRNAMGVGPVWAMHNDAVIQMIKARVQLNADGFDTSTALNSSPLTSALVAVAAAVGRLSIGDPNRFLENDVLRLAELWVLLVLATSALAAWIVWRMARPDREIRRDLRIRSIGSVLIPDADPVLTVVEPDLSSNKFSLAPTILAAFIGATLPLTWYFAGFAFAFGFLNSTLSFVILLLAWAIYLELPDGPPVLVAGMLSLATVAMLATWAPLALIPAALAILSLLRALWEIIAVDSDADVGKQSYRRYWSWLAWIFAALPVPLYGLFVTWPDFQQQGEELAVEGGFLGQPIYHIMLVSGLALIGLIVYAIRTRSYAHTLSGGLGVLVAGAAVLFVLTYLNRRVGLPGWGYYPFKAAWAVTSLLLVIGLGSLIGALLHTGFRCLVKTGGIALITSITLGLMSQYTWQQLSIRNVFAPVEVLHSTGSAYGPWRANILFDAYRADSLTLLAVEDARWMVPDQIVPGDGRADVFANFWLLQIIPGAGMPHGEEEQMRTYAYTLDPRFPEQICAVLTRWGQPTNIQTVDPSLEPKLRAICPGAQFGVVVNNPAWPRS